MNKYSAEIKRLVDANPEGRITPEFVVAEATNASSPLHDYFEWNDRAAAHGFRINQARELISSVRVEVSYRTRVVNTVAYVHDPWLPPREQGYMTVTMVTEHDRGLEILQAECSQIRGRVIRLREIAKGLNLVEEAEERLAAVVD